MRGIISAGAYIPYNRLQRSKIGQTLGTGGGRGTRAVASFDEDTTTLGVEAGRIALRGAPGVVPGNLFFATTDPAYLDKNNATGIAAALDLPTSVGAFDMVGSARSGMGAAVAASGLTADGRVSLVVASDLRTGLAGGSDEANNGDAAGALLFGDDAAGPVIAEYLGGTCATAEFLDRWRTPGASNSKVWEERFAEAAYAPVIEQAVADAYQATGLAPENIDKVVMTGLAERAVRSAAKYVGVAPDKYVDNLYSSIGNTGTAHWVVMLAAALESAQPGQVIMVVNASDGCDVLVVRTTDALSGHRPGATVATQIEKGNDGLDYAKFLTWKGMLTREPPRRPDPERPGGPPMLRSERWKYAFYGSKDRSSGAVHLPPQRVSVRGGAVDEMDLVPMADVPGTIATFTIDRLAFSMSPPLVAAVVDYDGGGRFPIEMTDCDPAEIAIGMRVEMTFRRLFTADGIHNYFWKGRPLR
ncbi:MAG: hydroxymethylglutaryl-CoA synthase [Acidimicrobiia bacterium]|nr:hydroxymethylglutaryl-CoA synthase [Acidimicrobiia bacterium]